MKIISKGEAVGVVSEPKEGPDSSLQVPWAILNRGLPVSEAWPEGFDLVGETVAYLGCCVVSCASMSFVPTDGIVVCGDVSILYVSKGPAVATEPSDDLDDLLGATESSADQARARALRQFQDVFGQQANLLTACLDLRMASNGAADPLPEDEVRRRLAALQARLDTWSWPPSAPERTRFDTAVRDLVVATIGEVSRTLPVDQAKVVAGLSAWDNEEGRTRLAKAILDACSG